MRGRPPPPREARQEKRVRGAAHGAVARASAAALLDYSSSSEEEDDDDDEEHEEEHEQHDDDEDDRHLRDQRETVSETKDQPEQQPDEADARTHPRTLTVASVSRGQLGQWRTLVFVAVDAPPQLLAQLRELARTAASANGASAPLTWHAADSLHVSLSRTHYLYQHEIAFVRDALRDRLRGLPRVPLVDVAADELWLLPVERAKEEDASTSGNSFLAARVVGRAASALDELISAVDGVVREFGRAAYFPPAERKLHLSLGVLAAATCNPTPLTPPPHPLPAFTLECAERGRAVMTAGHLRFVIDTM